MLSMQPLTPKEKSIYDYICQHTDHLGYAPTFEEIRQAFGYKTVSSVQQFIEQLTSKGYLRRASSKKQVRGLSPVDISQGGIKRLRLEGQIAAGRLTEAVSQDENVDVPMALIKPSGEYFALKVKGDSMINDGIFDGDTVIIRRQASARQGQTVVALVGDEATIKRYHLGPKGVELHPANPAFDVIEVGKDEAFRILGVLSSLIRQVET